MTLVEEEIRRGGNYTTVPNGVALEKTTFWQDFTIAERISGRAGVEDTFKRAFEGWKEDIRYLTALYVIMNWKGGEWYGKDNELAKLYFNKQAELDKFILDGEEVVVCDDEGEHESIKYKNFTQDEVSYFYQATD